MKRIWQAIGTMAFWLAWPLIWIGLRLRSQRTRIVVVAEGQVLLLRGWLSAGNWGLPGGGLHQHEEATQGALRELREETGLRLKADQLQGLGEIRSGQYGLYAQYHCYLVELPQVPPTQKQWFEILDIVWLTPAECAKKRLAADARQLLQTWPKR